MSRPLGCGSKLSMASKDAAAVANAAAGDAPPAAPAAVPAEPPSSAVGALRLCDGLPVAVSSGGGGGRAEAACAARPGSIRRSGGCCDPSVALPPPLPLLLLLVLVLVLVRSLAGPVEAGALGACAAALGRGPRSASGAREFHSNQSCQCVKVVRQRKPCSQPPALWRTWRKRERAVGTGGRNKS